MFKPLWSARKTWEEAPSSRKTRSCWSGISEGYRYDQWTEASLSGGKAEGVGPVQPQEEMTEGEFTNAHKVVSRGWSRALCSSAQHQDKWQWTQTETEQVPPEYEEKLLYFEGYRDWKRLTRVLVKCPADLLKTHVSITMCNLLQVNLFQEG